MTKGKVYLGDSCWYSIANGAAVVERAPVLADLELADRFGKRVSRVLVALGSNGPLAVALCDDVGIVLTVVIKGDNHE
jgi:hypothetical protein